MEASFEMAIMRDEGGKLFILEINPGSTAWVYYCRGWQSPGCIGENCQG